MAINTDTYSNGGLWNGSQSSVTVSHTCNGTDRFLIVFINHFTSSISSLTYNGVAMTYLTDVVSQWGYHLYVYYLKNPDQGTHNIVLTMAGNSYISMLSRSFTGTDQTSQPDVYSVVTNVTSPASPTLTSSRNSWLLVFQENPDTTATPGANTVTVTNGSACDLFEGSTSVPAGSHSLNYSWTGRASDYIVVSVKEAPSLDTNLNSYWKLDESSGNASDSVGANTLTNTNTVTYESGKINNSALTNPTGTKYFTKTSPTGLPSGATSHTINFWAKPRVTQSGSVPGVIAWGTEATNQMAGLGFSNTGLYYLGYNNDAAVTYSYATGSWSMYTVTVDASTKKVNFYVDGALVGTEQTLTNTPNIGTSFVVVGAQRPGNLIIFDGNIDEVGIWGRILDISEIKALYNSGSGVQYNFSTLPSNIPYIGNSLIDHDQGSGTVSYYNNGDLLVVSVNSTSNDVSAMTYNGASMTQLGTAQYFSTYARYHSTWYLVNPSVGTYNIVTTGGANWQFDIFSAYNVDQTTPISGATTTNTSGANAYVDVTTTVNNAYAIGVGQIAATSTAGTDTTMLVNGTPGNFYTLRSTNPVATAGTFRVQSAHAGSVGYFLRGFGINPVATITANSGFFALM